MTVAVPHAKAGVARLADSILFAGERATGMICFQCAGAVSRLARNLMHDHQEHYPHVRLVAPLVFLI